MSKEQDELLKRLIKEGDPDKVIMHLVKELKRLRAMVRTMKEDRHISQEQWSIRKAERDGKLSYIPLPGEHDL
ncbi:MAG: hypothetical protein QGH83_15270 [Candidatus Pacebacteria bacterium]|jgi:hypothetical protein|nr:hypothetical protein [Candidatus Paceibacterota bacterium]|tara:strand:- start:1165 stop:1383 length:219 start_codon:yes stop_codon:yes gene_type:complete